MSYSTHPGARWFRGSAGRPSGPAAKPGEVLAVVANWSSYLARVQGAPVSIALDLNLKSIAPVAGFPTAYTVAVDLRRPDSIGMPTLAEFKRLDVIEAALDASLRARGALAVGRVTGRNRRSFHYYGPRDAGIADAVDTVMRAFAEYAYVALAAEDRGWTLYLQFLYPDERQLAFANDLKRISLLRDAGDEVDRPRAIEHIVDFDQAEARDGFARAVESRGFEVLIDGTANSVRCIKHDSVNPLRITEMRTALTALAEEFGGNYGGWACRSVT